MPTYDFYCETCDTVVEQWLHLKEEPQPCPTCGKPMTKLLSAPPVHFKGSGFYATDYGRKFYNKREDDEYKKKIGKIPKGDD